MLTFYEFPKQTKISATAATDCCRKLLQKANFKVETDGKLRKDKQDYYSRIVTKEYIRELQYRLSFLSDMVDFFCYSKFDIDKVQFNLMLI